MYYEKILNFVSNISEEKNIPEKDKTELYEKIKDASERMLVFPNVVIDVKLGASEYKTQEEYDEVIRKTIRAAQELNSMYNDYYGEDLFERTPKNIVEVYDLSSQMFKEMRERARNDK